MCQQVAAYCELGWCSGQMIAGAIRHYYPVAAELSVENGLLMRGNRIGIPAAFQLEMLDRIHTGHQGIKKVVNVPDSPYGGQDFPNNWRRW